MIKTKLYPLSYVLGPYFHKGEQRFFVVIKGENRSRLCMLFSRFKMQEHLQRLLTEDEHVDHIDENKQNDEIDNLQILTPAENTSKTHRKYREDVVEICFQCESAFTLSPKQQVSRHKNRFRNGPFCSKRCSGQYSMSQRY